MGDRATKSSSVSVHSAVRRVIVIAPVDEIRRTSRGIAIAPFPVPGRLPEPGFTPGSFCEGFLAAMGEPAPRRAKNALVPA